MFDFMGKYRRLGPVVVAMIAVIVGVASFAVTRGGNGDVVLRADQRAAGVPADQPIEPTTPTAVANETTTATAARVGRVTTTTTTRPPETGDDRSNHQMPPPLIAGFGAGRIVYERAGDVYAANTDGANAGRLATGHIGPSWAPDRNAIAVVSGDGPRALFVRTRYNETRIVADSSGSSHPAWSPDGAKIAFGRFASDTSSVGCCGIWLANAEGTSSTRIVDSACINSEPAWTPDGKQIVFWSSRNFCSPDAERGFGNFELFIVNADGTDLRSLNTLSNSGSPSVSPDGKTIAFSTDRDDHHTDGPGTSDIWTMNIDGSNQTRITTHSGDDLTPDWSPDGSRIVFRSDRDGGGLFTMKADGSDVQHIITGDATNPDW